MYKEFNENWGSPLLSFMEELQKETTNFPKYVLRLIEKHFGFSRLLIFPYAFDAIDIEKRSKRDALSNFITLNIESKLTIEYADKVRHIDLFAPKHLPTNLRNEKVVFTEDLMSAEKYRNTEYYAYMAKQHLERQACIYLRYKNDIIGNICIFRSKDEPPFTDEDRALMEYLNIVISNQYVIFLKLTGDAVSQRGFDLFFRNNKMGAIMLNSRLTVLMANAMAQEHCELMMNYFSKESGFVFRSGYQRRTKYNNIQQVMDWIGLDLVNSANGTNVFTSLQEDLHFYYSPLIFIDVFGNIETRHLVLSTRLSKSISVSFENHLATLTHKEKEILRYVVLGYKNEEISGFLHVSIFTVRTHISNIYRKFNVNSRAELLVKVNKIMTSED
jgi:DNA-binding CsgD family transcriptional regulator